MQKSLVANREVQQGVVLSVQNHHRRIAYREGQVQVIPTELSSESLLQQSAAKVLSLKINRS